MSALIVVVLRAPAADAYASWNPITIDGDAAFAMQGWPGSGTPGDPYVIEGLDIDARGGPHAILVANTNAYLAIRDNRLHGTGVASPVMKLGSAIGLVDAQNVRVVGNEPYDNDATGLQAIRARNLAIDGNDVLKVLNIAMTYKTFTQMLTSMRSSLNSNPDFNIYKIK